MPRTVPSIPSHIPSDTILAADYNSGPAAANTFLTTVPIFMGYNSAGQTFTSGTGAAVALDAENVDSDNGHSNTVNNSRYTAQVAGWYAVSGVISYAANATNVRIAYIQKNGTTTPGADAELSAASAGVSCIATNTALVQLNVNDYVELWGFQNSGSPVALAAGTQTSTGMSVWWVAHV